MMKSVCAASLLLLLTACSNTPKSIVEGPLTVRPPKQEVVPANNGAIYQASNARLNLFEDRIARHIGDTLTIQIEEKLATTNKAETKITTSDKLTATAPSLTLPTFSKVPVVGGVLRKAGDILKDVSSVSATGNTTSDFAGKGDSSNNNTFSGSITVTVVDVLNNGNLVVAGEKQIASNYDTTFVRLSGVIDPRDIKVGNTISSTKMADARIEQRGDGLVDSAQAMGWLSRFFLSFLPF
ncbi:flagellar basal body L-ring protein FlgH [Leeia aquatica]|nr:flagellar basal body L-ring protein FlgH [Leeia aquatica]